MRRIKDLYNPKLAAFLEYVVDSDVENGDGNLDCGTACEIDPSIWVIGVQK